MNLSTFFSLTELTQSETAAREGILNQPKDPEVEALRQLCRAVLDPLRSAVDQPLKVNSGYRSPALNQRIGGAANSQHVEGKAADIQAPDMSVLDLFKKIIQLGLPFDQVIYEARSVTSRWVHVSHNGASNRGEIRVAEFGPNGKPLRYPLITTDRALAMTDPASRGIRRGPFALEYHEVGDEPELEAATALPPRRAPKRSAKPTSKGARKKPVKKATAAKAGAKAGAKKSARSAAASKTKKVASQTKKVAKARKRAAAPASKRPATRGRPIRR
jgi:hypothetical protein